MKILAWVPVKRSIVAAWAQKIGPTKRESHLCGVPLKQRIVYEDVKEFSRGMEKWSHLVGVAVIRGQSYLGYIVILGFVLLLSP